MVSGRLFSKEVCPVFIKATQDESKKDSRKAASSINSNVQDNKRKEKETKRGWSDAVTFMECLGEVFVAEVHPKQNEYGCVVLIVDGSKTHITLSNITKCKELGVEIVVLAAHLTDAIQLLDRTVFRALKRAFTRLGMERYRECKCRAASPASFVELWTKAFVEAATPQNIRSGFKSCSIGLFDPAYFLQYLPPARLKKLPTRSTLIVFRQQLGTARRTWMSLICGDI